MDTIKINGKTFDAYTVPIENVSMMMINAKHGMLACGYVSMAAADKFGDTLAVVRGVSSYDDMLTAQVAEVSKKASERGIKIGMTGKDTLLTLS